jgi:hypothetical protein
MSVPDMGEAGSRLSITPRILRARGRDRPVVVVVRPHCVLHHEDRAYGEGELLRLSIEEARRLEEQGVVLRPE